MSRAIAGEVGIDQETGTDQVAGTDQDCWDAFPFPSPDHADPFPLCPFYHADCHCDSS